MRLVSRSIADPGFVDLKVGGRRRLPGKRSAIGAKATRRAPGGRAAVILHCHLPRHVRRGAEARDRSSKKHRLRVGDGGREREQHYRQHATTCFQHGVSPQTYVLVREVPPVARFRASLSTNDPLHEPE
jgi:hypothetical protein